MLKAVICLESPQAIHRTIGDIADDIDDGWIIKWYLPYREIINIPVDPSAAYLSAVTLHMLLLIKRRLRLSL